MTTVSHDPPRFSCRSDFVAVHAADQLMVTTSSSTDSSGHYVLADVPTDNLLVYAERDGGAGNAVSALDASYVLQNPSRGCARSPRRNRWRVMSRETAT